MLVIAIKRHHVLYAAVTTPWSNFAAANGGPSCRRAKKPGLSATGVPEMCDYSLHNVRSRPAKVGDKLTTRDFGTCTRGFAAAEDRGVAVCVLPGTELAFSSPVTLTDYRFVVGWKVEILAHATAIFRQVNKNEPMKHHDALEFPDGRIVLLTRLSEGQEATVLQLPAQPATTAEADIRKGIAHNALIVEFELPRKESVVARSG